MNLNKKTGPFDLTCVSRRTCSYVWLYTPAVANSVVLLLQLRYSFRNIIFTKVKVKVKVALEQATKTQRGSSSIALLFF